jgi:pentapeptide repeat protein
MRPIAAGLPFQRWNNRVQAKTMVKSIARCKSRGNVATGRFPLTSQAAINRDPQTTICPPTSSSGCFPAWTHSAATSITSRRIALTGASLRFANLTGANLHGANLGGANLWGADLQRADLTSAVVVLGGIGVLGVWLKPYWMAKYRGEEADLSGALLVHAPLAGAQLWEADLTNANLQGADLQGAAIGAVVMERAMMVMEKAKGRHENDLPEDEEVALHALNDQGYALEDSEPAGPLIARYIRQHADEFAAE